MRMYRCDRCGGMVSASYKSFIRKPSRGVYRFGKKGHLCPDCADDLRRWLKTLKFADTGRFARSSPRSRKRTLTARAIGPSESVRRWGCELLPAV